MPPALTHTTFGVAGDARPASISVGRADRRGTRLPDSHISSRGWRRACKCRSSRREKDSRLPPFRKTKQEAGGRAPDGEPSRTPSTTAHQQILDFQKNSSLMIWSPERWFIPPSSLLFASPIATRTLTVVDPRTAVGQPVRPLPILYMILIHMMLFRQRRPRKTKWPGGWRNPLKRLDSRKDRAWIFLPLAWIFLP